MRAVFFGGPLDGTIRAIENHSEHLDYRVLKPLRPTEMGAIDTGDVAVATAMVTGRYTAVGRCLVMSDVTTDNALVMEWRGWSDGSPYVRDESVPAHDAAAEHASIYPEQCADEPGVDAMHFSPEVGDAEIRAWEEILHPAR